MPIEKGAQFIVEDILREAKEKAAKIIRDAKKEARIILDAAQLSAKENKEQEIKNAKTRGGNIRERILAESRMRIKKEILQKREELINETFKKAEANFRKYSLSPKYEKDMLRITISAIEKLGAREVVILANRRDLKILEKYKDQITREFGEKHVHVSFGKPIQTTGGVRVIAPDFKIEVDETFEGNMRREFETLRIKVAKILFEGSK